MNNPTTASLSTAPTWSSYMYCMESEASVMDAQYEAADLASLKAHYEMCAERDERTAQHADLCGCDSFSTCPSDFGW
jgi:hypothetical protein